MHELRGLIELDGGPTLGWRGAIDVRPWLDQGATTIFLGMADFAGHFAVDVSAADDPKGPPFADWGKFIDVRSIAPDLKPGEAAALAQARSMIDWHDRHGFCARCGNPTQVADAGYSRHCRNDTCKASHFPRTDPVVIMMVTRGDRCLLGRSRHFPKGSYSCLAGFMEPGETIEQAVSREIMEEAGIATRHVRYHASQPWPFPSSLMIGCFAEATSEAIDLADDELEDARWFDRDQVRAMMERSLDMEAPLRIPPPLSLAHQLAKAWIEGREPA
ncbi:NADH pyrophosphatase [Oceanibacterium hippocampi]|uniref:NAD(+) diphosphatase n=2 Tax=Oceanibacterium hippocampi TaxID=745714 RepID=A0A1Y5RTI8_9PROT|nr:NADH pyrophosphatase [Oceanibacterium hippocampi]